MKKFFVFLFIVLEFLAQEESPRLKKISLGKNINSKYDELAPILSRDGQTLFFCREGDPTNVGYAQHSDDQDIWLSKKQSDGSWGPAEHIKAPFNSYNYDFPIGTSTDGNTLYIGNTYLRNGTVSPGVSKTRFIDNKWSFPEAFRIRNYYNQANLVNYNLAADEKTLILNLKRDDTVGKMDLYVSFLRVGNKWSEPLNLGHAVNSAELEVTPFLAADMKTLYFSSDRLGGVGGFDTYVTRRLDDSWQSWSTPENLGPFVNTTGNDISYIISPNGRYAIFSTESGKNGKDLFQVNLPKKFQPFKTVVISGKVMIAGKPGEAKVIYETLQGDKVLGVTTSHPRTGSFKIVLPSGKKYGLRAKKNAYLPVSELIDLSKKSSSRQIILNLKPIKKGVRIRFNNIFFTRRSAVLTKNSQGELNLLAKFLLKNPKIKIQIEGHTDSYGSYQYNERLSLQRATSVKRYLLKKGVKQAKVKSVGFGERNPVAENTTQSGRAKNRRVEFTILEN